MNYKKAYFKLFSATIDMINEREKEIEYLKKLQIEVEEICMTDKIIILNFNEETEL